MNTRRKFLKGTAWMGLAIGAIPMQGLPLSEDAVSYMCKTYTVAFVTARDESMKVVGAYDFVSRLPR